jgi:hypothetical protein
MYVTASVSDTSNIAEIKTAQISSTILHPGQTAKISLVLQPLRAAEEEMAVEIALPEDMSPGKYKLMIGSAEGMRRQIAEAQPHRFKAFTVPQVVEALRERLEFKRAGVYMGLPLGQTGLALEKNELPDLPPSRVMLLTDKSRKITTARFRPLVSAYQKSNYVLLNQQIFDIEVRENR